jgi:hypothetical protein
LQGSMKKLNQDLPLMPSHPLAENVIPIRRAVVNQSENNCNS